PPGTPRRADSPPRGCLPPGASCRPGEFHASSIPTPTQTAVCRQPFPNETRRGTDPRSVPRRRQPIRSGLRADQVRSPGARVARPGAAGGVAHARMARAHREAGRGAGHCAGHAARAGEARQPAACARGLVRVVVHEVRLLGRAALRASAATRALKPRDRYAENCGIAIAARMPMMATTTSSSINVKPLDIFRFILETLCILSPLAGWVLVLSRPMSRRPQPLLGPRSKRGATG